MNAAAARNFQLPLIDAVKSNPGANVSDAYRAMIRLALNQKADFVKDLDLSAIPRASIFIPSALAASISDLAETHEMTFQVVAAGLAQAGANHLAAKATQGTQQPDQDIPFSTRPAQATFYRAITRELSASKIVVAEASTGIGKGRALMAAAITAASDGKKPIVIAAPTVNIVNQLWGELTALRQGDENGKRKYGCNITATIMLGSNEFADDIKLQEWLSDPNNAEQDPAVAHWIRLGAPHTTDDAVGQFAKEQGIELAWLMADLHRIASNMPVEDFVLKTDRSDTTKDSQSRTLLHQIRDAANRKGTDNKNPEKTTHAGADLILCTHAMLALGQKTNWAVLPQPAALIIDEAHLLEETLSRINSHQISMFAIRYRLARFCKSNNAKKGSIPRNALAQAMKLMKDCQSFTDDDIRLRLNDDNERYSKIGKQIGELATILGSKAFAKEPSIKTDLHSLLTNAARMMQANQSTHSAYLQFTPDKRYPLLSVGADKIDLPAGALWKAAQGGAILASATMYITDEYGEQKCDYIVRNLAIPLSRLATPIPVVAPYLYTIPTLHTPAPHMHAALSRPEAKDRKDDTLPLEDDWLKNLAIQIANIAKTANGGTLVLVNAYKHIEGIAKHLLAAHPELTDRLIPQTPRTKFSKITDAFKQAHTNGKHPILLALGPAWTGLDLNDGAVSAEKDTLLTNLVIACCPIGLNQSPTQQRRIALTSTNAIAKEALLTFKQGLGRLIRRDGVTERHIWILDARIWSPTWLRQFTGPAKRLLAKYKTQQTIA